MRGKWSRTGEIEQLDIECNQSKPAIFFIQSLHFKTACVCACACANSCVQYVSATKLYTRGFSHLKKHVCKKDKESFYYDRRMPHKVFHLLIHEKKNISFSLYFFSASTINIWNYIMKIINNMTLVK